MAIKTTTLVLLIFQYSFAFCQESTGTIDRLATAVLESSDSQKHELKKITAHFSGHQEKLRAARFIIAYLDYHTCRDVSNSPDSRIIALIQFVDTRYYTLVKDKTLTQLKNKAFQKSLGALKEEVQKQISSMVLTEHQIPVAEALHTISATHLIEQIEHAFWLREHHELIRNLPFDEFCDYVLPFENTVGLPLRITNKQAHSFFSKYLPKPDKNNLEEVVERYILTVNHFRQILGKYPFKEKTGFEELFFTHVPGWNCFDASSFAAFVLNATGLPVTVEFNNGYKTLSGRHSYCKIPESIGDFTAFSPEGSSRENKPRRAANTYFQSSEALNTFRKHYALQDSSPYALADEDEALPDMLSYPLIHEVTRRRFAHVHSITLPLQPNKNKVAYLYCVSPTMQLAPMSWGIVDRNKGSVTFDNVIADRLYIPVYYNMHMQEVVFAEPFIVSENGNILAFARTNDHPDSVASIPLRWTAPHKPIVYERINSFVGAYIVGATDRDFKMADTLAVLTSPLDIGYQDIVLHNRKAYPYYRMYPAPGQKRMIVSEIQFLTDRSYGYTNVTNPTELPHYHDRLPDHSDGLVRILEDSLHLLARKPHYDGKVNTVPPYPNYTLSLPQPQIVEAVRLTPQYDDNVGIDIGDKLTLYAFYEGHWMPILSQTADSNEFHAGNLGKNVLYLLKNDNRKHPLNPFYIDDRGYQQFIYERDRD